MCCSSFSTTITSWKRYEYDGLNLLRVDEKYDTAGGAIDTNDPWRKKEVSTHKPGSLANLLGKMVYLYSGANLNTDTPSASYFYAYFYDAVGNLLWTVDNSGYLNYTFSQDAFGNELSVSPFSGTPWSSARTYCTNEHQTGKWNDPFTGLYFSNAKWYDSGVGRSCSRMRTPITEDNTNPYVSFENNPLDFNHEMTRGDLPLSGADIYQAYQDFTCAKKWGDYAKFLAEKYIKEGTITDPPDNPGAGNTWPWVHCMTNCYIQKYCGNGTAWSASLAKEFYDLAECVLFGSKGHCWSAFQKGDFDANRAGREAAEQYQCCMVGCREKGFGLGTDEMPHGPFWWLRDWWEIVFFPICCSPAY